MIVTQQRPSHHHATAYREGQGQGTMEPFGPYLLLRVLGRGGMGVVYVARSRLPGHPIVALKRLRADAAQVPSFRERFEHECALALRLRHPRLVHVLDAGKVGDIPYIASELVLGMNVATIARRLLSLRRRAPLKIAVRVMLDMLAGLDYVHQAHEPDGRPLQLVHRDVTPGNVLVGYDGISRLADFGLAKSQLTEQLQLTATGMILGTPKFLAPEVAQGGEADARTDLYGLGAVMYRLLVGRGPHDGELHEVLDAVLSGPPTPIDEVRRDLPKWFTEHVERLMDRNPDKRPFTAREAGLRLVEDAQKHDAVMPRSEVGRWLQELFDDECPRQTEEFLRDQAIDISLVPAGSGTRVLKTAPMPLQGPVTHVAGSDEELTLLPEEAICQTALGLLADPFEEEGHPNAKPNAPMSAPRRMPMNPSIESTRLNVDQILPPSSKPNVPVVMPEPTRSSNPIPRPKQAPSSHKITSAPLPPSSRPWAAMVLIALAASAIGGGAGFSFARTIPVEARRFALVERLGGLQHSIAQMRAAGTDIPYDISERVETIRGALVTGKDLTSTQLELQELELLVQSRR